MKKASVLLLTICVTFIWSCKENKKSDKMDSAGDTTEMETEDSIKSDQTMKDDKMMERKKVVVNLESKSKSDLSGKAVFTEKNGKVILNARIQGLAEGMHAIHIHQNADCSSPDGKSAGGHWNPTKQPHGKWGSKKGYHKGDIGNFKVNAEGMGTVSMTTDEWCIGCGDENKDILGHAIIVHDGVDDFVSQPSGAAGTRVGCGIIEM